MGPPGASAGVSTHESYYLAISSASRASLGGISVTLTINITTFFYRTVAGTVLSTLHLLMSLIFTTTARRQGPLLSANYREGNIGAERQRH